MIVTAENFDIKKVKLVIWDLDNTFWNGVISEEKIASIPKHVDLVKELSLRGVVNSICSKNDMEICKKKLQEIGIWDFFVFPSIDWTPKSQRVLSIIKDMNLRPANTLFLDDEPANLQRVLLADDTVMCGTAQDLADRMMQSLAELKSDDTLSRLHQYQQLQNKVEARKAYTSDEEFLYTAEIKVYISWDCRPQIDRIFELVARTNQLNYTKLRSQKEDLLALIQDKRFKCAYVSCADKFCQYGIVGFFALNAETNELLHFLFSCRTIGMGVEQFIYAYLNYPHLKIVGDVVNELNTSEPPPWIQLVESMTDTSDNQRNGLRVLMKGPCDISQTIGYFSDSTVFDTEFAYVSEEKRGVYIESFNHTSQILLSQILNEQEKEDLVLKIPFIDRNYFKTELFSGKYDFIVFSMLTDYGLGLYQNKSNPKIKIAFGQYTVDYTKKENWDSIMQFWLQGQTMSGQVEEMYQHFCNNYVPIGRISDEELIDNLETICKALPENTKLILLNGAEKPYVGQTKESLRNRDVLHRHLNCLVSDFAKIHSEKCKVIDVNPCLQEDMPYLDTINHYKKVVYFRIAKEIQAYINSTNSSANLQTKSWTTVIIHSIIRKLKMKGIILRNWLLHSIE